MGLTAMLKRPIIGTGAGNGQVWPGRELKWEMTVETIVEQTRNVFSDVRFMENPAGYPPASWREESGSP
ncbi:MAG: hypothetical protein V3T71_02015, partial [Dehalococcoidia bacterium]